VLRRHGFRRCVACIAPERNRGQAAVVAATSKLTRLAARSLHTVKNWRTAPAAGASRTKAEQEEDRKARGGGSLGTSSPPTAGCSFGCLLTAGRPRLCLLQAFMAVYKTLSDEIVADEVADQQARPRVALPP
jgi:hypothetical protein